jgi:parvulin-like peptidyl-prolyl isomerase
MRHSPDLRWAALGLILWAGAAAAQTTPPAGRPAAGAPGAGPGAAAQLPMPAEKKVSPTAVAATVNGEAVYEVAVQRALERVPAARRTEVRPNVINDLVGNLLVEQSLRAAGYKVEQAEVDARINDMKAELKKVKREFEKLLAEHYITEEEMRYHITADLRWQRYANAQVTDKALLELFEKNKDLFDESVVQAWHILLTPVSNDEKTLALVHSQLMDIKRRIEADIEAGLAKLPASTDKLAREKARATLTTETFARYAKEKSECPSKTRGGWVGWFPKLGPMTPSFAEAAFALQPFVVSNPVRTPFGFHLIMVSERKPGKVVTFKDKKDVVKEVFFERLHESVVASLRQKARIVVNPPPK